MIHKFIDYLMKISHRITDLNYLFLYSIHRITDLNYICFYTACTKLEVEPVGRWFEGLCLRRRHKHSLSQHSLSSSSSSESEDDDDNIVEDDSLLLSLDPKEWKV